MKIGNYCLMLLLLNKCILIDGWNFPRVQFMTGNISFKPRLEEKYQTQAIQVGGNDIWQSASWDIIFLNFWCSWHHVFNSMQSFKVSNKKQHPWVTLEWKHIWSPTPWSSLSHVTLYLAYSFFGIIIFTINLTYSASNVSAEDFCFLLVLCLPGRTCFRAWFQELYHSSLRKILNLACLCQILLLHEIPWVVNPFFFFEVTQLWAWLGKDWGSRSLGIFLWWVYILAV